MLLSPSSFVADMAPSDTMALLQHVSGRGSNVEYSAGLQASDSVAARFLVFQEALDKGHKQFARSSY